ncbi:hypothetical protein GX48_06674 [Paracoccidioides brasiliensis]|nr:hypothetical protein GX48_06674 [Paracoccidioides brasiliensis]
MYVLGEEERKERCNGTKVQECKSARVQEYKSTRVQECKSAKVQECKSARVQEYKVVEWSGEWGKVELEEERHRQQQTLEGWFRFRRGKGPGNNRKVAPPKMDFASERPTLRLCWVTTVRRGAST